MIHQLIIVVAAATMYFANLGATGLWDLDEALYSSIAREMAVHGDWVVPRFNSGIFYDKPPLMFWLMMGSFKVLGVSEFAARLPAALLAIGTALATYHLARRLFSANVGFLAGLILASNVIFVISARAATVDSALTFITTLVMLLFAKGAGLGDGSAHGRNGGPALASSLVPPYVPKSWLIYAAIGVLLGLTILAKGPVGFLLPAASLELFLLVTNQPAQSDELEAPSRGRRTVWTWLRGMLGRLADTFSPQNMIRVTWSMRPLTVLAIAASVAVPWFVWVAVRTDGEWLAQFVTKYNLGPFVKPFLGHRGPFYYHFVVVLIGLFPWSIFLGPTAINAWRAVRGRGRETPSYVFLVCWIGVFFGFWSICSTKLPHYVLPAYPALAILTACFLDAWLTHSDAAPRYVMPTATGIFVAVGVLMLAVLPWVAARYVPGEENIALMGLGLVLGGDAAIYFLVRGQRSPFLVAIAASSVLFIVTLFAWTAEKIDRHQHSRPLLAAARDDSPAAPQFAGYKYCDASTVFYAGGPVTEINDSGKLRRFVQQSPHPYVVTTGDGLNELESQMPGQWRIVARRPRFLSKGEIVVLSPRAASTAQASRDEKTIRE